MREDPLRDTLWSLGWRLAALVTIVTSVASVAMRGAARHETSERLLVPVEGVTANELVDTFSEPRRDGRIHEAVDIPAPRGTRVVAATAGRVERIFSSESGGLGVYQLDRSGARCLYYAHLDGYARGLEEGQSLQAGDVLGFVGSTGNAERPHLHFAVLLSGETGRCAGARATNPMGLFR